MMRRTYRHPSLRAYLSRLDYVSWACIGLIVLCAGVAFGVFGGAL